MTDLEHALDRVNEQMEWIEGQFKVGRANGYPDCCIRHYVAFRLTGIKAAAAEVFGSLVSDDRKSAFVPCPDHRVNPPAGYSWEFLAGSPAAQLKEKFVE